MGGGEEGQGGEEEGARSGVRGVTCLLALKKLDLSKNQLKKAPGELADCLKLKEVNLGKNPFRITGSRRWWPRRGPRPTWTT